MSDDTTTSGQNEPFDQTNGLAQGLEGDDRGTVGDAPDDDETGGVLGEAFRGIADPLAGERDGEADGATPEDGDDAVTPYSEEGR
ncbi:hypothetical protein NVV95_15635 [Herbiconiux sp. CPCC 205716]|uniref:Uncharacterized protein n=1 Tax=Herbiconiux gentiana TaxID=2970912 RepID=A0ABT2GIB8_9MICO|nr:hypothetical protein [Herbiconiux gentiana]MCS5715976.1 hypothetical protein [Herbiconiux gentiana]